MFGSWHSCLEFRVWVRTLALHVLSLCVSVRPCPVLPACQSVFSLFFLLLIKSLFPPAWRPSRSSLSARRPFQSPLQSGNLQSPLQSPLQSGSPQSPLQSPLQSRSPQSPLQWRPKRLQLPQWWLTMLQYPKGLPRKPLRPQRRSFCHPALVVGGEELPQSHMAWGTSKSSLSARRPFQSPLLARRPSLSHPSGELCFNFLCVFNFPCLVCCCVSVLCSHVLVLSCFCLVLGVPH